MCDLRKCIFGGVSVRSAAVIEADGEAFGFDKCTDLLDETFGCGTSEQSWCYRVQIVRFLRKGVRERSSRDGVAGRPGPCGDRASAVMVAMSQAASDSSVSGSTESGVVVAVRGLAKNEILFGRMSRV